MTAALLLWLLASIVLAPFMGRFLRTLSDQTTRPVEGEEG